MSGIRKYIEELNNRNRKALSIFLTAGFPDKENFTATAKRILDAGADMIELGIPFSDPLADGPIIQASSKIALDNGVNIEYVLDCAEELHKYSQKPIILMGYANPIVKYGLFNFFKKAEACGVSGLIVPDVPLEEHRSFFDPKPADLDLILLTTPTSSDTRIEMIDSKSEGFIYCVSVTGTTGVKSSFGEETIKNLERTYSLIRRNKMMIGFGISTPDDIRNFSPYCDGVIVGSRIMKSFISGDKFDKTLEIVSRLSSACRPELQTV
jgi:tryptophan synthase alpha chain